jgi:hypothetical protein
MSPLLSVVRIEAKFNPSGAALYAAGSNSWAASGRMPANSNAAIPNSIAVRHLCTPGGYFKLRARRASPSTCCPGDRCA